MTIKSITYDFTFATLVVTTGLGRQTHFAQHQAQDLWHFLEMSAIADNIDAPPNYTDPRDLSTLPKSLREAILSAPAKRVGRTSTPTRTRTPLSLADIGLG